MRNWARILISAIAALGLLPARGASAQTLTGGMLFSANASGAATGIQRWNTRGGDGFWNLYVVASSSLAGAFINSGDGAGASISVPLATGANNFVIFANRYEDLTHTGLNLFFDGGVGPGISVTAPVRTGGPIPGFSANSSPSTVRLDGTTVAGSGALVTPSGGRFVTLTKYYLAAPGVHSLDRVSPFVTSPDANLDFVGEFTLEVGDTVPEPTSAALLVTGLIGALGLRRKRRA